jgi:hypothetical protein
MVEVLGADIPVPDFSLGIGIGKLLVILAIFFIAVSVAIVIWVVHSYRTYNKRIIVFENVSGQGFQPILKDRARLIKLGSGGEELLYLKKKKVYRTAYGKKMGKNTYWFVIGQDGYWYNSVLGDLDAKMGMLDIEPIDRDMRYMHVAIRKNIEGAYKSKKILTATAIVVGGIVLVALIIVIGGWYNLSKIAEMQITQINAQESTSLLVDKLNGLMSTIDRVCSQSGVRPA